MGNSPHVRLVDIARRAKVSVAAVSMSLGGKPGVAVETRARIVALAEQLGYRPNPYVSALMRSRRKGRKALERPVLALVHGLERADAWRESVSPTRRQIREGVLQHAAELGYDVNEFWLHQGRMTPDRFSRMLHARGIQGLILGPMPDGAPPPALHWAYFSTMVLSVPVLTLPLHVVCNDHFFSSFRAVDECHRLGYRRPGLLMRRSHTELFQGRWEAGFITAQRKLPGVELIEPLLLESVEDPAAFDVLGFRRWLARERPDVIVTSAAAVVEGVLTGLGWRVPRDIGIAGLSSPEIGHRSSGIHQDGRLIGATAVAQLASRLERNERGLPKRAITVMIEGVWNPGETLRPQSVAPHEARKRPAP